MITFLRYGPRVLFLVLFFLGAVAPFELSIARADTKTFNIVAVDVSGVKMWLPSTLTVNKGDVVKIHAVTKIKAPGNAHGFAIPGYRIEQVITEKGSDIEFIADKAGIFALQCHLHPAHIGGQLIVLD